MPRPSNVPLAAAFLVTCLAAPHALAADGIGPIGPIVTWFFLAACLVALLVLVGVVALVAWMFLRRRRGR